MEDWVMVLVWTVVTLSALGLLAAAILYVVAQKFKVEEDPRIDEVEKMLPGANCGGCGFPGCRGMADALVKTMTFRHCSARWAAPKP